MLTCVVLISLIVLGAARFHINPPIQFSGDINHLIAPGDSGSLANCGDAQHNFTFSWSPRSLQLGKTVTVAVDFTAHSLIQQATADITVWAKGIPEPIIKTTYTMGCDQVPKFIQCPMQAGQRLKFQYPNLPIPDTYPVPSGTYIVKIDAKSQDGQPVICAKGEVPVVAAPEPDWDDWGDDY